MGRQCGGRALAPVLSVEYDSQRHPLAGMCRDCPDVGDLLIFVSHICSDLLFLLLLRVLADD